MQVRHGTSIRRNRGEPATGDVRAQRSAKQVPVCTTIDGVGARVGGVSDTTATLAIAASAAEVWAVLADFGEIARWAPNVDHSCLLSAQRDGVGAVRRIQSGRRTLLEEVVEWVDGERLSYVVEGLPSAIRSLRNTWQLDDGDGLTEVTLTSSVDVGSRPPQKLVAQALGRQLSKVSNQMLRGLDDHLRKAAP